MALKTNWQHRKKAVEDAFRLVGIPKIPMKPFRWARKHPRWARKGRKV